MDEQTTTESAVDQPSGVSSEQGIPVDDQGMAIPDTQLETTSDEAESQPDTTTQGETVDNTEQTEVTTEDDLKEWAEKKNLPLDDPLKLAKMYRDAEKSMHEAKQNKLRETVEETFTTDADEYDPVVNLERKHQALEAKIRVADFYAENPEARQYDATMSELVQQDPSLAGNLKALYALARFNEMEAQSDQIRTEGGREALKKLALKAQAAVPKQNAVNANIDTSTKITPQNVDRLVANNDLDWFKAHQAEINAAMEG